MKKNGIFILSFILLSSCSYNRQEKERLVKYNKALMTFSPDQVAHFPKDLTHIKRRSLHVYYPKSTEYNFKAGIILNSWVDSSFFQNTLEPLKLRNIHNYSIVSDSLIFIGDTINNYSNILCGKPIPSFSDIEDQFGLKNVRLNEKEQVYIIEAKQGEFLEEENLVKGLRVPNFWKHGFSRGIVVDSAEHRLIYWLILW